MRIDCPATEGQSAIPGRQAVIGTDESTKDRIIEVRVRFAGATTLSAEFDDRKFQGSQDGQICVSASRRSGSAWPIKVSSMRNPFSAMPMTHQKRSARQASGRSQGHLPGGNLATVGDDMRPTVDGQPVAFLKSSCIAHPIKSKVEFGCAAQDGNLGHNKLWNAEAGTP